MRASVLLLTQYSILRQRAVTDGVWSLVRRDVVHGDTDPPINLLVMQDMVPVTVQRGERERKERGKYREGWVEKKRGIGIKREVKTPPYCYSTA